MASFERAPQVLVTDPLRYKRKPEFVPVACYPATFEPLQGEYGLLAEKRGRQIVSVKERIFLP